MSNSWNWLALLDRPLEAQDVLDAIACAEKEGYAPWKRGEWSTSLRSEGHVTFDTREAASAALAKGGGRLFLEVEKPEFGPFGLTLAFRQTPPSVGLYRPDLWRGGRAEPEVLYLLSVYLEICRRFRPRYGLVFDEYRTEEAAGDLPYATWDPFNTAGVLEGQPPVLLWCVNVFERALYEPLRPRLVSIEHEVISLGEYGVAVRLARFPGSAMPARLGADGIYS